jgi:hypothetical protein
LCSDVTVEKLKKHHQARHQAITQLQAEFFLAGVFHNQGKSFSLSATFIFHANLCVYFTAVVPQQEVSGC